MPGGFEVMTLGWVYLILGYRTSNWLIPTDSELSTRYLLYTLVQSSWCYLAPEGARGIRLGITTLLSWLIPTDIEPSALNSLTIVDSNLVVCCMYIWPTEVPGGFEAMFGSVVSLSHTSVLPELRIGLFPQIYALNSLFTVHFSQVDVYLAHWGSRGICSDDSGVSLSHLGLQSFELAYFHK